MLLPYNVFISFIQVCNSALYGADTKWRANALHVKIDQSQAIKYSVPSIAHGVLLISSVQISLQSGSRYKTTHGVRTQQQVK